MKRIHKPNDLELFRKVCQDNSIHLKGEILKTNRIGRLLEQFKLKRLEKKMTKHFRQDYEC